jgi:hypothetical protein
MKPGWGLQFVECWDARKIYLLLFAFFGLVSLLIAVLWCIFKRSVQDAFAISAYFLALGAVGVGSLQTLLIISSE